MADIKYNIDITETGYIHFEGNSLQELETFLYPDENFKDCCGIITYMGDKGCIDISVASVSEYGVYIGFSDKEHTYLSISDRSKLSSVVDVWGGWPVCFGRAVYLSSVSLEVYPRTA